jgi:hypothetical protein
MSRQLKHKTEVVDQNTIQIVDSIGIIHCQVDNEDAAEDVLRVYNSHEALIEALETVMSLLADNGMDKDEKDGSYFPEYQQARQALKQARG